MEPFPIGTFDFDPHPRTLYALQVEYKHSGKTVKIQANEVREVMMGLYDTFESINQRVMGFFLGRGGQCVGLFENHSLHVLLALMAGGPLTLTLTLSLMAGGPLTLTLTLSLMAGGTLTLTLTPSH
jgi:hypothetical protein